ncbi:MAG: cell wall metabolism sensor histidine kinase WalK [Chloroflexi bacterium]|nr:cell wall metabolism sensor histidine kinase WalK [Chloroflexota bacterium]
MGDLLFIVVSALIAAALGVGLGIVLSRTIIQRIADRAMGDDEEPDDRAD